MSLPDLIYACREAICYLKPREVALPHRFVSYGDPKSGYLYVFNPFRDWMSVATLKTKKNWQSEDKVDQTKELEDVVKAYVLLMIKLISAFREEPLLSDDELTGRFSKNIVKDSSIKRAMFPDCQVVASSGCDMRNNAALVSVMRDQIELGDQFDNPEWDELILKKAEERGAIVRAEVTMEGV